MTEKPDLNAIEARANAATEGPWGTEPTRSDLAVGVVYPDEDSVFWDVGYGITGTRPADAEFIAHARKDVPALVAYARELEGQLAAARASEARLVVEAAEAEAIVERVRAIHQEVRYPIFGSTYERIGTYSGGCKFDQMPWPCATVRALEGATDE